MHEFVIQTVAPSGREIFEKKLSRMIEWVDPKYDWVHGPRSVVGLYTAKAFMKECLEPLGDTPLTRVVMNALSPYFKTGVQVEVVLPDYATLPGVTVHSRLVGL